MKRVLVITSSFDYTVTYIKQKYEEKLAICRFDFDYFDKYLISFNSKGWRIACDDWDVTEADIASVYYRKPTYPNLQQYEHTCHFLMQKDMLTLIDGIVESFRGACLTKPSILRLAENKAYQLLIAKNVGFDVPPSLITNDKNKANNFIESYSQCIIKPLSVGKLQMPDGVNFIQTNYITGGIVDRIEFSPIYLQKYEKKDYEVRLTIINKKAFAVKIDSENALDWRSPGNGIKYSLIDIPVHIMDLCLKLMSSLNIDFGAFDFIVSEGSYIFLEVNPNGQWLWLEKELEIEISQSVIDFLLGGKAHA